MRGRGNAVWYNCSMFNTQPRKELHLEPLTLAREIVNAVEDKKAENILLLDLRPDSIIADFFIICTANSERQIRALADNVREVIKEKFGKLPTNVEGENTSGWVLMDYGDVVAHIMSDEMRRYYDLETLWSTATPLVRIQ